MERASHTLFSTTPWVYGHETFQCRYREQEETLKLEGLLQRLKHSNSVSKTDDTWKSINPRSLMSLLRITVKVHPNTAQQGRSPTGRRDSNEETGILFPHTSVAPKQK